MSSSAVPKFCYKCGLEMGAQTVQVGLYVYHPRCVPVMPIMPDSPMTPADPNGESVPDRAETCPTCGSGKREVRGWRKVSERGVWHFDQRPPTRGNVACHNFWHWHDPAPTPQATPKRDVAEALDGIMYEAGQMDENYGPRYDAIESHVTNIRRTLATPQEPAEALGDVALHLEVVAKIADFLRRQFGEDDETAYTLHVAEQGLRKALSAAERRTGEAEAAKALGAAEDYLRHTAHVCSCVASGAWSSTTSHSETHECEACKARTRWQSLSSNWRKV